MWGPSGVTFGHYRAAAGLLESPMVGVGSLPVRTPVAFKVTS